MRGTFGTILLLVVAGVGGFLLGYWLGM